MSACDVLEYPKPVAAVRNNGVKNDEWTLTRDAEPEDDGIYLAAIRHSGGEEEIRPIRYDAKLRVWGNPDFSYMLGEVLAWREKPAFPDLPYVADTFEDEYTKTRWFLYSDGAVFKQAVGMKAPRRDKAAEIEPTIRRILHLSGVQV